MSSYYPTKRTRKIIEAFEPVGEVKQSGGVMNSGAKRKPANPHVQWNHVDGPLLICSDGHPHWLTWFERVLLALRLTTVDQIAAKQSGGEG